MVRDPTSRHAGLESYVGWTEADAQRIGRVADSLLANVDELVDDFYAQILEHPEPASLITGGQFQIGRLKSTLRLWIRQLLRGPYDGDYLVARLNAGRRHVDVGLDQIYANAALSRLRWKMQELLARILADSPDQLRKTAESLNKRIDLDAMIIQDAYQTEYLAKHQALSRQNLQLRTVLGRGEGRWEIIGESTAMQAVYRLIERAGPSDKPILIEGESGTGKELVARALHRASSLADMPLVAINCAALPETLLESELFGHEKGAFTDAIASKQGLFEVADGGTLFIDEIGELAGGLQAKLLRVLDDGMLRRVGAVKERQVKVRLLTASNRDLEKEVEEGRFREDLYYRINVLRILVPPLRERAGDIPRLVEHFAQGDWKWESDLMEILERYSWPGNVRQLQNALERTKILADDDRLLAEHLPPEIVRASNASPVRPGESERDLDSVNRSHVADTLARCEGNKARTARALGVSRRTLYRLLEKYEINRS